MRTDILANLACVLLAAPFVASHPAEAADASRAAAPLGPDYTSAEAERYPWPMGSYIRDARYFAGWEESCQQANKSGEVPQVDCWYTWERFNLDNHLQWSVRIEPSSKVAWYNLCSGIYDNVKRHCGHAADCGNVLPGCWCDKKIFDVSLPAVRPGYKTANPTKRQFRGYHFFFPTRHWKAGEDNIQCITKAIQEALCAVPVMFKKGRCYQKLGSQLHPGEGQRELREPYE